MLRWAFVFFVFAVAAFLLGYYGLVGGALAIAHFLLVFFVASLVVAGVALWAQQRRRVSSAPSKRWAYAGGWPDDAPRAPTRRHDPRRGSAAGLFDRGEDYREGARQRAAAARHHSQNACPETRNGVYAREPAQLTLPAWATRLRRYAQERPERPIKPPKPDAPTIKPPKPADPPIKEPPVPSETPPPPQQPPTKPPTEPPTPDTH
jgi:uncharacterized membrane protein YtjA (UPF0391 family)